MPEDSSNPSFLPMAAQVVTAADRNLPHSIEAEEYLLSCCFLGGAEVLSRCVEAGIRSASFCVATHRVVYEQLLACHKDGASINGSLVAEEGTNSGQFDASGPYRFLAKVSSRGAAIAYAGIFIEEVRELSLMRDIVSSATRTVGECYSLTACRT